MSERMLIDAGKYMNELNHAQSDYYQGIDRAKSIWLIGRAKSLLLDQPIVEERKHAHWIFYYGGDDWVAECSICGNSEYGDTKEDILEENPHCRKCGAIMDEVNNNE